MRKIVLVLLLIFGVGLSGREVPYFRQNDFVGFGLSACMPTSAAMILKYFYPYSQVNPGKIYHSGTQKYQYKGPIRFYKNNGAEKVKVNCPGYYFNDNYYYQGVSYYTGEKDNANGVRNYLKIYLKNWNIGYQEIKIKDLTKEELIKIIQKFPVIAHYKNGHYFTIIDYNSSSNKFIINDPYAFSFLLWKEYNNHNGKSYPYSYQIIKNKVDFIIKLIGNKIFNNYSTLVSPEDSNVDAYVYGKDFNIYGYKYKVYNHPINDWTYKLNENNQTAWYKIYDLWIDNIKGPQKFNEMEINYHGNIDDIYYYYGNGKNFIYLNKKDSVIDSVKWKPALYAKSVFDLTYNFYDNGQETNLTFYLKDEKGNTIAKQIVSYTNSKTDKHVPLFQKVELKNGYYVEVDKVPYNINLGSIFFQDYHNSFGSFVNKCYYQMNSSKMSLSKDCKLWLFQKTSKKQFIRIWTYFKNYYLLVNTSYYNLFNDKFLNFVNQLSTLYITRAKFAEILTQAFSDKLKYCSQKERNKIIMFGNLLKENPKIKYNYDSFLHKWIFENKWTIDGVILRFNGIWQGRNNDMLKDSDVTNFIVLITLQRIFKKASK